jgi:carbonic anhydrase
VRDRHEAAILEEISEEARMDRLCELNVVEQVLHVCQTTTVADAWRRQQSLAVHGWIYDLRDGLLRDLGVTSTASAEVADVNAAAVRASNRPSPAAETPRSRRV